MELWKPVPDGAREIPPGGVCPMCRASNVHRSRAHNPLEAALRTLTPLRPFRCSNCRWRGWRIPSASQGPVHNLPPLPDRKHRRGGRTPSGRKIHSPGELIKRRARRHVLLAVMFAAMAGGALVYCQHEEPSIEGQ